jgi:surface antigen
MSVFASIRTRIILSLAMVGTGLAAGCDASSIFLNQGFGLTSGAAIGNSVASESTSSENQAHDQGPDPALVALAGGGLLRDDLGRKLTLSERKLAVSAEFEALEYSPVGETVTWGNQFFGNSGVVVSSKTYDVGSSNCRQYVHMLKIKGKSHPFRATACKEQDGTWVPLT